MREKNPCSLNRNYLYLEDEKKSKNMMYLSISQSNGSALLFKKRGRKAYFDKLKRLNDTAYTSTINM